MRKLALVLVLLISTLTVIGCTALASTPNTKNQEIVVTYFSIIDVPPNIWDSSLLQPGSGDELVITNINIENHGYNEFETNKGYFSAIVRGVPYKFDPQRYVNNLLPDTKIANAEKAAGNITFTLPDATFGSDITLKYTGPEEYNITWINKNISS